MPKGIPKNKLINQPENKMTNILDNKNEIYKLSGISTIKDAPVASAKVKDNDDEYTTSPDGKYKVPKPKRHFDFLEKAPSRIPYITDPAILADYHIYWATDEKPHTMLDMGKMGYTFVDNNRPGFEHAIPTHSGYRQDNSPYMSYCFYMSMSEYKRIQAIRQKAIADKEQENLQLSSSEDKGLYATEQMKLGGMVAPKTH